MATYILPTSQLRTKMPQILSQITKEAVPCFVTKNGRAVATLLPIELYDQLMSDLEDKLDEQDAQLPKEIRRVRKEIRQGKTRTIDQILGH